MKLRKLLALAGMALAGGLLLAGQAQAVFMIDDFNTATTYTCDENGAGCGVDTPPTGTNIIMTQLPAAGPTRPAGWTRTLSSTLQTGDGLEAEICNNCQAAHHISGAGGSTGITDWEYLRNMGDAIDVSAFDAIMFDYAADLDGGVIRFTFDRTGFTDVVVESESLDNTNNSSNILDPANRTSVMIDLPSSAVFAGLESVRIEVIGTNVPDLDLTFDTVKLVPEPGTLALLGLGLAGLGFTHRRRAG